jgi:hypothetical protein
MEWLFIETPFFMKRRETYFGTDENFRLFQEVLTEEPAKGDLLQGGAGLRKIRYGEQLKGKGKSGGLRVIYLQVPQTHEIYLLHVYLKGAKDNLTREETAAMAAMARQIKKLAQARKRSGS